MLQPRDRPNAFGLPTWPPMSRRALRRGLVLFVMGLAPVLAACSGDAGRERAEASPPPEPSPSPVTSSDADQTLRARLTPRYLEGEWCALYSQERGRYVFADDGSYQEQTAGFEVTSGTIEALLEEYPVVVEVEADRFVLKRGNASYRYVFTRGPC